MLFIFGMCRDDRGRFLLIPPGLAVCGREESAVMSECHMKQVKGDLVQRFLHVVYCVEHVLTFIALIASQQRKQSVSSIKEKTTLATLSLV